MNKLSYIISSLLYKLDALKMGCHPLTALQVGCHPFCFTSWMSSISCFTSWMSSLNCMSDVIHWIPPTTVLLKLGIVHWMLYNLGIYSGTQTSLKFHSMKLLLGFGGKDGNILISWQHFNDQWWDGWLLGRLLSLENLISSWEKAQKIFSWIICSIFKIQIDI